MTDLLTFEGKAAHSSTPALGVNAIDKALAYTLSVSARVLSIAGGTAANMIPGRCELVVAAPYEKGQPVPPELIEKMAKTFHDTAGDLRAVMKTMLASNDCWMIRARSRLKKYAVRMRNTATMM